MNINKFLYEYELLSKNIVFVDGLTRTGKALLNSLLLGYENISSIQFLNVLEQLMPLYVNNKITKNGISSFLRLYLNENFYNYYLSRNLNFRPNDLTSVLKHKDSKVFYENLSKHDGDNIIDELNSNNLCFQFQTHDILTHYSKFNKLNIDVRLLELFRHPVDTIHSWYKRGWGTRFDQKDPRSGTTLFLYNDYVIPHYVTNNEKQYLDLNEMEKCVFMHNILLKKCISEYKKLDLRQKNKILLIKYEDLLQNVDEEINKIAKFLNLKISNYMSNAKREANVPRDISIISRTSKLNDIISNTNNSISIELQEIIESYELNFYNLKD